MSKIRLTHMNSCIYLSYNDYPEKRQLKDFYKLYKKASGFVVREYREENETVLAITDNVSSVLIGYDPDKGCFISSGKSDVDEAVKNAFEILCYRYSGYSEYRNIFDTLEVGAIKDALEGAWKKHEEMADGEGIIDDINILIHAKEMS